MTPADTVVEPHEDLTTLSHDRRSDLTRALLDEAHATSDPEHRRELLDRVVLLNHRVARAVAARYQGRGIAGDDLEQAACEGLVKAAAHFDPALRHDFLSYAVPTIRGEVQRYFRDHGWTVRPPRRLQQLQWQLNRTTEDLCIELGREPSVAEVCTRMGIDDETHREVVASFGCFQPTSLDQPVNASPDLRLGDTLAAAGPGDDAGTDLDAAEARATVGPILRRLKDRDREIVFLRYYEDRTQQEIGELLGVTQMQVSRLLSRILRDLRVQLC